MLVKQDTAILTPFETLKIRENLNEKYQAIADGLLHTQMRVEELWEFMRHPEWYSASRRCIDLPKGAIKKVKTLHKERTVRLSIAGCSAVEYLIKMNPDKVSRQAMGPAMKRAAKKAGFKPDGITSKMYRKTMISWLMTCVPEKMYMIAGSAGHTLETMQNHYTNLAFEKRDIEDMRAILKGWGET